MVNVRNLDNREVADFRTAGIFIQSAACFHCYSIVSHSSVNHNENMRTGVHNLPIVFF